jgi:flagellar motor switch protein FliM
VSDPLPDAPTRPAGSSARAERRAKSTVAEPYDFRRPIKLSREHSRILQIGFDGFARQATTVFTSALRTVCQVTLASIEQRTYAEYVDSLGGSTYMTLFAAEPMSGSGVLEMPLNATMACVDHMLGGPGGPDQQERPLSEIESAVVNRLTERLLGEMRYSLSSIVPLEPAITAVEYSPQFAQVAAASDVMVVVTFELRQGATEHALTICLPFAGLLPYVTAAAAPSEVSDRERTQRARATAQLHAGFQEVPIDVMVQFRPTKVEPDQLTGLQVGDVIRLAHPAAAPLDVMVADMTFAHATPGAQGKRLAALVVAAPQKENQ